MPEIPKPNTALLSHTRATSPISGGTLRHFASDNAQSLAAAGRVFNQGVSALAEFQRNYEDTENKLAAAEAKNLFRKADAELTTRMSANPGSFDMFQKWAEETDKAYEEGSKQYLERMTPEYRKLFEEEMKGVRISAMKQRLNTANQAKVTADYNRFQALFKELAMYVPGSALRLLEGVRGNLISEQEFLTKKEIDLPRISQSADVRRAIDGNAPDIIGTLKQVDADGNFVNFKKITPEYRQSMIRYAEAKDSRRRMEENLGMLDQLNSGKVFTKADIEKAFEGKTSAEDLRQKNEQIAMVKKFNEARQRQLDQAGRAQKRKMLDAEEYNIMTYQFSGDVNEAQMQYSELKRKIITGHSGDGPAVKRLLAQLDDSFKASHPKAGKGNYKKSYIYIKAKNMLDEMKSSFYSRYPGREDLWYLNTYNNSKDLEDLNFKMASVQLDNFIKNNPAATEHDVRTFLDNLKRDVNNAECDKLVQFWNQRNTASASNDPKEIRRKYNGKIAIFGPDKKFIKWKDDK